MFDFALALGGIYLLGVIVWSVVLGFVAAIYGEPLTWGALLKLAAQWPYHLYLVFR